MLSAPLCCSVPRCRYLILLCLSGSSDGEDQAGVSTSPAASVSSSLTDKHTTTSTTTAPTVAGETRYATANSNNPTPRYATVIALIKINTGTKKR